MLRSTHEILSYTLRAKDGRLGRVKDLYFDDAQWSVRYFVVDTHRWLPGRRVLLFSSQLGPPNWLDREIPVGLSTEQIKNAPAASEELPVSREHELDLARYYLWQPGTMVPEGYPVLGPPVRPDPGGQGKGRHLRSLREVTGYRIHAADGEIGHVEDLIAETEGWSVRYIVIDTRNWLPGGQKVLISPAWIDSVEWSERKVLVDLSRGEVLESPPFDPAAPVNREVEARVYDYYGRPRYWL